MHKEKIVDNEQDPSNRLLGPFVHEQRLSRTALSSALNGLFSTRLNMPGSNVFSGFPVIPTTTACGNFSANRRPTSLPVPSPSSKSVSSTPKSSCAPIMVAASSTLPANTTRAFSLSRVRRSLRSLLMKSSSSTTSTLFTVNFLLKGAYIVP